MTCDGGWTHLICVRCWNKKNPDRMVLANEYMSGEAGSCCYCGHATMSGIYVREDPHHVHGAAKAKQ